VRGEWVAAAQFAVQIHTSKEARDTDVEAPSEDELVKVHQEVVKDANGAVDARRVVLKGGFSVSGYDVRIHGEGGKYFFPQLEEGDLLAL
jgi:hypothetical protein